MHYLELLVNPLGKMHPNFRQAVVKTMYLKRKLDATSLWIWLDRNFQKKKKPKKKRTKWWQHFYIFVSTENE